MPALPAQTLNFPPTKTTTYVRVVLPERADPGRNHDFPGVRILDAADHPVPYALDAAPQTTSSATATLEDYGSVEKKYTQFTADFGPSGTLRDQITIHSSLPTYFTHVDIFGSDDRRTWTTLATKALYYRVSANADAGIDTISFSPTRYRFLRVRIEQPGKLFPVDSVSSSQNAPPPKERVIAQGAFTTKGTKSTLSLLFAHPYTHISRIYFQTTTPYFSRHTSFTGIGEQSIGQTAQISRFQHGSASLWVPVDADSGTLTITVNNESNPPLADLRASVLGPVHWLIFAAHPGGAYRLVDVGSEASSAPHYDLADLLAHQSWTVGAEATFGATSNVDSAQILAKPSLSATVQRYILPIVLIIALLAFGAFALSGFRESKKTP